MESQYVKFRMMYYKVWNDRIWNRIISGGAPCRARTHNQPNQQQTDKVASVRKRQEAVVNAWRRPSTPRSTARNPKVADNSSRPWILRRGPTDVVSRERIGKYWECWQRGKVPLKFSETYAKMRTPRNAVERSGMRPAQWSVVRKPPCRLKPARD